MYVIIVQVSTFHDNRVHGRLVTTKAALMVVMMRMRQYHRGEDAGAVDSLGIPGWGKVDALARALINLDGLSISHLDEAHHIQELYYALKEFDKRPLIFTPHPRDHVEGGLGGPKEVIQQSTR